MLCGGGGGGLDWFGRGRMEDGRRRDRGGRTGATLPCPLLPSSPPHCLSCLHTLHMHLPPPPALPLHTPYYHLLQAGTWLGRLTLQTGLGDGLTWPRWLWLVHISSSSSHHLTLPSPSFPSASIQQPFLPYTPHMTAAHIHTYMHILFVTWAPLPLHTP